MFSAATVTTLIYWFIQPQSKFQYVRFNQFWCTICTYEWLSCTRAYYQWNLLSFVLLFTSLCSVKFY